CVRATRSRAHSISAPTMHHEGTFDGRRRLLPDARRAPTAGEPARSTRTGGQSEHMEQSRSPSATPPVNLLWTGGWDSTFRLLSLVVQQHRCVQPYYVLDDVKLRPSV